MKFYSVFFNKNLVSCSSVGYLHNKNTIKAIAESLRCIDPNADIVVLQGVIDDCNRLAFVDPRELGDEDFDLIYPTNKEVNHD